MSNFSKSRLLATSAIAGLSILHLSALAHAQESFGIHNDQPETLEVIVAADEEVAGEDIGVYADNGAVVIDNAGEIRGNGTSFGSIERRPSGGVVIAQPGSSVTNGGTISGGANGIATSYFFSEDENDDALPPEARATDTIVVNAGLIRGDAGNGVALIGGGDIVNSGTIQAFTGNVGNGAQAIGVIIGEFPEATAEGVTGVGTVKNTETGVIEGQSFGALLGGGGTIDNAGTIRSTGQIGPDGTPFGVILTANDSQIGRTATLDNSGTVTGFFGMLVNQSLDTAIINNSGLISGAQSAILGLSSGDLVINNGEEGQFTANGPAIVANISTLTIDNDGLINSVGGVAINIQSSDATITNNGRIFGGQSGIATTAFAPDAATPPLGLAIGTSIVNGADGEIVGASNDAIRLVGGGSVVNAGFIHGINDTPSGTDGVSMFAFDDQDVATFSGSVVNLAGGEIHGQRFGVGLSSGGTIENAGDIAANAAGAVIQNGLGEDDVTGAIVNSGTIRGRAGEGVVGFGRQSSFSVTNSGAINGVGSDGVYINITGVATIDNGEDGEILGAASGVHADFGGLALTNAGTIRGDGGTPDADVPPNAGVTISGGASAVTNSGTISGNRFGITTANYFNGATGQLEGLAVDTMVANSGTIIGDSDDGVRLIGGGSVTNSGIIEGRVEGFADGVSMFAYSDQVNADYSALVTNEAEGEIAGQRFGVILSGGGDVVSDGGITGVSGGVYIQGTALNNDPNEERSGLTASVVNGGTISGTGAFGGSGTEGYGVGFGSDMTTATLVNSGTITSAYAEGVSQSTLADVTITNEDGGAIEGATSGIYSGSSGTLAVDNAGTIRGNGAYDGFEAAPDAGITIATAGSRVTNSGTISGAGAGITTAYLFDDDIGELVGVAVNTQVTNSGTIAGEGHDGVRLIGGGSVTNSGAISGAGGPGADGVSMFRFEGQAAEGYAAAVANGANGTVEGERFGIILSGGGSVDNAGTIGGDLGGVVIQSQIDGEVAALTGILTNSGTISGGAGAGAQFSAGLASVDVDNSGTITGATLGLGHGTSGTMTLTNSGTISGGATGVASDAGGAVTLVNSGMIAGETGAAFTALTQTSLDNAGVLAGGAGIAVQLGSFDDSVTLRTGSAITGVVDAGAGIDSLTLTGDILELTAEQQIGGAANFETLDVAAGYWSTTGFVGEFGGVTVGEGATLQVNEIEFDEGLFTTPIFTPSIANDGLLAVNFSQNDAVSALGGLSVTGTGGVQLLGEAVFTLDTATLAHTGGTTVSNGGLILTGTLLGNVTTEGDGFFQLGAGGTEGNFAGDIVNNGTFIFNRSDDYDFLGAFSGTGNLVKDGDSILAFLGDYNFNGVTSILAGSVRVGGAIDPETDFDLDSGALDISGTDQTIGGLSGGGEASVVIEGSELTVEQEEDTIFAGNITGGGSLVKNGAGVLNLTGTNSYTGPTAVGGGTLAVNGSITSDVTVNAGGTLGGNGSVGDTAITEDGTLAPGNSIGRLTVNGGLTFAAGSIYEVEVNAAGQGDRVDATGRVTIESGAAVAVLAENGTYSPRTDYVIVTGATGVTGTFGSVTSDLAFLDPFLRYGPNSVTLSLYRNDTGFADVAVGFNQASVATAVQGLGIDNILFETVLMQNAATAQASFGDLSGEILASTVSGLTDDSRHLRGALLGLTAPEQGGAFVWGSAFGGWGDFDAGGGRFAMDTDHKGFVTGIGYGGNGFAAALSAGIGGSDFRFGGRNDSADVESKYLAAHATYGTGAGVRASFGLSYSWHDIETSRTVSVAPLAQTLTSKRDADTLQVFGELGYDLAMGNVAVTPFLRLAHVDTEAEGVTEAGGNAALIVGKTNLKATFLSLGARFRLNAGEQGFQPFASAAWNRTFDDRAAVFGARFVAGGPGFGIIGAEIPKNSAEVEAGFDYATGNFRIGVAYSGTLASDRNSHGGRIAARIAF